MLKIYIDAATNPLKNLSGGGVVVVGNQIHQQHHIPLTAKTNHEAEFEVLIWTLDHLLENDWQTENIILYSDSKLVVSTVDKNYTKNAKFAPYLLAFQERITAFPLLIIQWIPESKNRGADHLARQALAKQQN